MPLPITALTGIFQKSISLLKKMDPIALLKVSWDAYMQFMIEDPELYSIMIGSIVTGKIPPSGMKCYQDLIAIFAKPELKTRLAHSPARSASIYLSTAQGSAIFALAEKRSTLNHEARDAILNQLIQDL